MPHFGQRFSPSVEAANWLSVGGTDIRRSRRTIIQVASSPTPAASSMATSNCVVWSMAEHPAFGLANRAPGHDRPSSGILLALASAEQQVVRPIQGDCRTKWPWPMPADPVLGCRR
jgi:hypothetical protein